MSQFPHYNVTRTDNTLIPEQARFVVIEYGRHLRNRALLRAMAEIATEQGREGLVAYLEGALCEPALIAPQHGRDWRSRIKRFWNKHFAPRLASLFLLLLLPIIIPAVAFSIVKHERLFEGFGSDLCACFKSIFSGREFRSDSLLHAR